MGTALINDQRKGTSYRKQDFQWILRQLDEMFICVLDLAIIFYSLPVVAVEAHLYGKQADCVRGNLLS